MNSLKLAELTLLVSAALLLARFANIEVGLTQEELVKLLVILLPWLGVEITEDAVRGFLSRKFPGLVAPPQYEMVAEFQVDVEEAKAKKPKKVKK